MYNVFLVLLVVASITIVLASLLMEPKVEGLGSLSGEQSNVFGKSASRSKEKMLNNLMIGAALVFLVSSIMLAILS